MTLAKALLVYSARHTHTENVTARLKKVSSGVKKKFDIYFWAIKKWFQVFLNK